MMLKGHQTITCFCTGLRNYSIPKCQRPEDPDHVKDIQKFLSRGVNIHLMLNTMSVGYVFEEGLWIPYILDGQHRMKALAYECLEGNHLGFQFPYEVLADKSCFENYKDITSYKPHSDLDRKTLSEEHAIFNNQARTLLTSLLFKNGDRRPSVSFDKLIESFIPKVGHDINAFKMLLDAKNQAIFNLHVQGRYIVENKISSTKTSTPSDDTILDCDRTKYYFGLIQHKNYDFIFTLI